MRISDWSSDVCSSDLDAKQWALFNIVIQLGAILAVVVLYWRTFWAVLHGMIRGNAVSWRFVRNLLVAFIPAALIGLILHNQIEALLGAPRVVAIALIVGGIAILVIEIGRAWCRERVCQYV